MFKKCLSLALVLILAVTAVPLVGLTTAYAATSGVFTYKKIAKNTAIEITDCNHSVSSTLIIPAKIDGLPVTSIGREAFYYCTKITGVAIPNSVTSIGDGAFCGCSKLKSVTIPKNVTSIGIYMFPRCTSLTAIKADSANKKFSSIGGVLFNKDATTLIYYPVGKAGSYTIPKSVKSIGDWAFYGCSGLTGVTIPDSVISLGGDGFRGCTSLTGVKLGNSVTSIGNRAFSECSKLISITIPNSVKSIGGEGFWECTSLSGITVGTGVTCIGSSAFCDTAYYNNASNWRGNVLYIDKYLIEAKYDKINGAYTIKEGTLCIADWAFYGCSALTGVTIPDGVKGIGDLTFTGCSSLKSVTIPDSVTRIGYGALSRCTSLKSVTIPNSVTSIGSYAFNRCTSLTSVTIPKSVKSIGDDAFYDCSKLAAIHVDAENRNYSSADGVLFNKAATTLIRCPGRKADAYKVPISVKSIVSQAFSGCTSLAGVTIPNSVTDIGDEAFSGCSKLTNITVGTGVTSIGGWAFYDTAYFNNASNWQNNVLYIGKYLIKAKPKIGNAYTIKAGTLCIADSAFRQCTFTSVTIPNSVKYINDDAFLSCLSLAGIVIPKTVTKIGAHAFGYIFIASDDMVISPLDYQVGVMMKLEGVMTYCYKGSAGEAYAKKNGFSCTLLSGAKTLAGIHVRTEPTKTSYTVGDTLNAAGLTLTAIYHNGTAKAISSGFTCSPTKLSTIGTQKITVTYGGKTTTFTVNVAPKTPTGIKAVSASYNSIKISWTAAAGATGYNVYRATSKTGIYNYLKSTTATSLTDTSRTTGTTYYYKVRAYKTVGSTKYYSGYSAIVYAKAVPAVPASFTAAKASTTSVKTTWKAVTGATGYEVWMATSSGGTYSKLITTTKATYTKTKLTKNKIYYFKVRAYKTAGSIKVYGAFTAIKSAKPS